MKRTKLSDPINEQENKSHTEYDEDKISMITVVKGIAHDAS